MELDYGIWTLVFSYRENMMKYRTALKTASILIKRNVPLYPIQPVIGMASGASILPMVKRKLDAAKYWPRICDGANLDTNPCWMPAVNSSAMENRAMAMNNPQTH